MENSFKHKIADSHVHTRFINREKTEKMLGELKETGVTNVSLLALPYRGAAENLFGLYMKHTYKELGVRNFGGIHVTDRYAAIAPDVQVRALLDLGCDGIKLMFSPDLRKYYGRGLDDPYYDAMFSLLEDEGTPVNIHVLDPDYYFTEGFPWAVGFPSKKSMHEEALRMLDKHPRLRVCFAHFMFLENDPDEAERIMEKYPNVWLDTTPHVMMYYDFNKDMERWGAFFNKYQDRILLGTDCNANKKCNRELERLAYRMLVEKDEFCEICYGKEARVRGFGFSDEVAGKICYENHFSFIGKEAKPLNKELFLKCCQRIIDDLDREPYDEYYVRGGELIPDLKKDPEQRIAYDFCKMAIAEISK